MLKVPLRLDSESNRCEGYSWPRARVIFFLSVIAYWMEQHIRRRAFFQLWLLGNFSSLWWEGMVHLTEVGDAAKTLYITAIKPKKHQVQSEKGKTSKARPGNAPPLAFKTVFKADAFSRLCFSSLQCTQ